MAYNSPNPFETSPYERCVSRQMTGTALRPLFGRALTRRFFKNADYNASLSTRFADAQTLSFSLTYREIYPPDKHGS